MPWEIRELGGEHCVVKEGEDAPIPGGCHARRSEAVAQLRALYAGEAGSRTAALDAEASPVAAGVALVAGDTGRVLMIQRALIDGEDAAGKWEFPGGKLDPGETEWEAARREFAEEAGHPLPPGETVATWLSANGVYRGFVHVAPSEGDFPLDRTDPDNRAVADPDNASGNYTESLAWFDPVDLDRGPRIVREEARATPWHLLKGLGRSEPMVASAGTVEVKVMPRIDWSRVNGATITHLRSIGAIQDEDPQDMDSLVASLGPLPAEALMPTEELPGPTPYHVSEDGLTADGHLALWASCHIGFPGCVKPPREESFDFYNLTPALLSDGRSIGVGRVTVGTGHAGPELSWRTAAAHYDDSGSTVALAHAIPDRWGIRLPSVILASASEGRVEELARSPLSGDWRRIASRLRLVAALGVNVPGYPVPRALVASGEVEAMFLGFSLEDAAAAQAEADELAEALGLDVGSRAKSLRASLDLPTG